MKEKSIYLFFLILMTIHFTACTADTGETLPLAEPTEITVLVTELPETSQAVDPSNAAPASAPLETSSTVDVSVPEKEPQAFEESAGLPPMLMVDDKIYLSTDEEITIGRCGVMDGMIQSTVDGDQRPSQNDQSNFGCIGTGYQRMGEGILDIHMDGTWIRFIQEDGAEEGRTDLLPEGVTVTLVKADCVSATLKITNTTDLDIQFGEAYTLLQLVDGSWKGVPYLIDNWAFEAIAYAVPKDTPVQWDVNWETFHGTLQPGSYRILKNITHYRAPGDYTDYEYTVEFTITEEPCGLPFNPQKP